MRHPLVFIITALAIGFVVTFAALLAGCAPAYDIARIHPCERTALPDPRCTPQVRAEHERETYRDFVDGGERRAMPQDDPRVLNAATDRLCGIIGSCKR